jgi:hypothetical protein
MMGAKSFVLEKPQMSVLLTLSVNIFITAPGCDTPDPGGCTAAGGV